MDCKHARMLLDVAHPLATELEAVETEALASHLADCPDCGFAAEAERRVDEKFGAAMRDVPVPEGLQQRIARQLTVERDARYRGWLVRGAGVAAAVLLVCWVGYAAWLGKRPAPDWVRLVLHIDQAAYNPETLEQEFADQGIAMKAPPKFDYTYLQDYGVTQFQGKQVPFLSFAKNAGNDRQIFAKVYILSDRQFSNLDEALNNPPPQASRKNIKILGHPTDPHVIFVVVFTTGSDWQQFLKPTPPRRRVTSSRLRLSTLLSRKRQDVIPSVALE